MLPKRLHLVTLAVAVSACQATELERKELMIQTALDGAFLACKTALNDPRIEWEPGARDYCLRIVAAEPECKP